MAVYRRKQAEVDALPVMDESGKVIWYYRDIGGELSAKAMGEEDFLAQFEPGEESRFTLEYLQEVTRSLTLICTNVWRARPPSSESNRPSYKEGYMECQEAISRTLHALEPMLKKLKEEYPEWDDRIFNSVV